MVHALQATSERRLCSCESSICNVRFYHSLCPRSLTDGFIMNNDSGIYKHLLPYASSDYISDLKGQRASSLQGLRLNWKLHREVEQEIVCVRQQEVAKLGEFVGQVAVRFVTEQVRSFSRLCRIQLNRLLFAESGSEESEWGVDQGRSRLPITSDRGACIPQRRDAEPDETLSTTSSNASCGYRNRTG